MNFWWRLLSEEWFAKDRTKISAIVLSLYSRAPVCGLLRTMGFFSVAFPAIFLVIVQSRSRGVWGFSSPQNFLQAVDLALRIRRLVEVLRTL